MFYSQCLVSGKGPLGAIWVAAYFFKKLKKAQVKETDIPSSVDEILQKELETLAYRVLAYLLLGVVRIYSKKVDYLFDDCNKMLIGVKDFVTKEKNNRAEKANTSLPDPAPCFGIVLPERFELDAFDLEILEDFHAGHVKPQEDITLKEGGWHSESTGQYSMERFDVEEYSAYSPDQDNTECERSARDVDMDAENVRSGREVDAIREILRTIEEEIVNPNEFRDHLDAACDINTGAENVRSTQEDGIIKETISLTEKRSESFKDHLNTAHDMDIDAEKARSALEEDGIGKTPSVVDEETLNPNESLGDHLNAVHDIDMDAENVISAQQGDTIREIPCVVENEPLNPNEPFGDHVNSSKREDSESDKMLEEASFEKMRRDRFPSDNCISPELIYGIEKQHSGDSPINFPGEVESVSEMCRDMENPRNLLEGAENHQDHSYRERTDSEAAKSNQKEPHAGSGIGGLHATASFEDWDSQVGSKSTQGLVTPEAPRQLSVPETLGATSPHFSIIPTPAAKEGPRVSRKRKCVIDDTVVISNKFMKQSIEDSSQLVTKRRKVPHTARATWRMTRLANPSKCFLDPLIPYRPLELQLLFVQPTEPRKLETMRTPKAARTSGKMEDSSPEVMRTPGAVVDSEQMGNDREMIETPRAASRPELEVHTPERVENLTEVAPQTSVSPRAAGTTEQTEIAPDTPVRESTLIRIFKSPESPNEKETRPTNSFASFDEKPAMFCEDRDLGLILMHDEVSVHEKGDLQIDSLSARTRKVAEILENIFMSQREREDEETVSLFQLCKGRTRKESARLFYETLVLRTKDYLEVKQDYPYSDILLMRATGHCGYGQQLNANS